MYIFVFVHRACCVVCYHLTCIHVHIHTPCRILLELYTATLNPELEHFNLDERYIDIKCYHAFVPIQGQVNVTSILFVRIIEDHLKV